MTSSNGAHPETRRMMETAIRRLNALEYLIIGAAMGFALAAGALTAWMLGTAVGFPFRITWMVASLLFFAVPGSLVLLKERRSQSPHDTRGPNDGSTTKRDDG